MTQANTQSKGGRPTKKTDLVLKKLEEAFALGCTDEEACVYAGISAKTLYNYQHDDKEFLQRKELLKKTPILKARKSVVDALEQNPDLALKFLERRKKDEFSTKIDDFESKNEGILHHLAMAALKLNQTQQHTNSDTSQSVLPD